MIDFMKKDPICSHVRKYYFQYKESNFSAEELEETLKTNQSDPLQTAGIGFAYISLYPTKARGYLSAYDSLLRLGFDGDSLRVLKICIEKIGYHALAVARLVTRYISTRDFASAIKLLSDCPSDTIHNLKDNSGFMRSIKDLSAFMNSTLPFDILNINSPEREAIHSDILEQIGTIALLDDNYIARYKELVEGKEYVLAENLSWIAYHKGERDEAFFELACKPLPTELDTSARVMFFRIEAANNHPKNPTFAAYSARSYLYSGEISSAIEVTNIAITFGIASAEVLHLHARALAVLGDSMGILPSADVHSPLKNKYYKFALHRKFSKAVLEGDSKRELHYRSLAEDVGYTLTSPLLAYQEKTPLVSNSNIKVAICISGQLRGIEKSSASILNDIASKLDSTIFVDTWKTQRSNFPTFTRVQRLIGNVLWEHLPTEAKMPDGFREHFPNTTKKLTSPITKIVNDEYVHQYFPEAVVRIEDESIFESSVTRRAPKLTLRGNLNQAKMFYKIQKCQETMRSFSSTNEKEFDVIIRTRPDLEIGFSNLKEYVQAAHENPNVIYVSYLTALGYGDQFAIGSRKAMDIYSSVWQRIWKVRQFKYDDSFDPQVSSFAGESLTANHLLHAGIDVKLIKPEKAYFTTMFSINAVDVKQEIEQDINASTQKELFTDFYEKYVSMRDSKTVFN